MKLNPILDARFFFATAPLPCPYLEGRLERHPTWPQCQARVHGVSGARFKKVKSAEEEQAVLKLWKA